MSEIDKKWYVVRAIGGQENKAKDFLESEISAAGLSDYVGQILICLLYTSPSPRDVEESRMPSSA